MPIYMDRHDLDAVTAKDVAEAHREDLKIQDHYHCRALTYWFDERRRTAFCLIEAPNEECVRQMHHDAHGLVPHKIIEVEPSVVNAFLGRIEDPKSGDFLDDANHLIINESAYRYIIYIHLKEIILLKQILGKSKAIKSLSSARDTIQNQLYHYEGREVLKDSKRIVLSFTSASRAVSCAQSIYHEVRKNDNSENLLTSKMTISVCAGPPVTEQNGLFSQTVQMAEMICRAANRFPLVISSETFEAYNMEKIEGFSVDSHVQILGSEDEKFIDSLSSVTKSIWNDPHFNVEVFSKIVGMSRSQLYRKIMSVSGLSPNDFIKEIRLQKALDLIEKKKGNIAEIAFDSGFNNPSYFSKCFQHRFSVLPSELTIDRV